METASCLCPDRVISSWQIAPRTAGGQAIWRYWLAKRAAVGTRLPGRGDIDPSDMLDFLPNVFLVDVTPLPSGRLGFRYRLAGTGMRYIMGGEIGGKSLSEALLPDVARAFEQAYAAVSRRGEPLQNNGDAFWEKARGFLQVETLLLPLAGPDGAVAMLLGHCALEAAGADR